MAHNQEGAPNPNREHQEAPSFNDIIRLCQYIYEGWMARSDSNKRLLYDEHDLRVKEKKLVDSLAEFASTHPDIPTKDMAVLKDHLEKVAELADNEMVVTRAKQVITWLEPRIADAKK
ncbi:MAG: hypothetical protein COT81_00070 [Candidatus Buchananbacteria bacterium CG10_big_fil_rev_8_21_14_0_10_42_9]|uniref:Uncharacterized protein n=1 Tax=Candidatus Buchananbacteria bacterium CG10_big_fil_rev_8_21_14_0_10_42_9 TaxID=1974526 RepID=A0A2H0W2Q8_9BACT|nr:MAG: hypothetical protein COT81_00070 [Candidatus Buchananbacteria bacterium CG10_big_fil_rev_8_21_14_0_10_42_9]